jgi:lipopolysaccharide export LptBFGC system permease protein LptF
MNYFSPLTTNIATLTTPALQNVAKNIYSIEEYEKQIVAFKDGEKLLVNDLQVFIKEFDEKIDELNTIDFSNVDVIASNWDKFTTIYNNKSKYIAVANRVSKIDLIYNDMISTNYSYILNSYQNATTTKTLRDETQTLKNETQKIVEDLKAEYNKTVALNKTLEELIAKTRLLQRH